MSYYLYILQSENGPYYIGSTNDVPRRLKQHNGVLVRSTKHNRPWKVVYSENFDTLVGARKRELQVKNWKSRSAIKRLLTALSSSG